ncbi:hypothetical protein CerSpe_079410 [Prunus speciosa]
MGRGGPTLSHLFFADDALFFFRAERSSSFQLMKLFQDYCHASGQEINFDKSCIFFSNNTPTERQAGICSVFGIKGVVNPGVYLGLPSLWGRSKKSALGYIKERMRKKVQGWKSSSLSLAGKEVLIKAVAMAIPAYPMTCFKFPASLCKEINSVIARFWWANQEKDSGMHWKAWHTLCMSKMNGGLGFRDLQDFNLALLGKQCWRLIQNQNALWAQVLKARYFQDVDFWKAKKGHRASWIWASLIAGRDEVLNHPRVQILSGENTNIWTDKWLPAPHCGVIHPTSSVPANSPQLVAEIMDKVSHQWNFQNVDMVLDRETKDAIRSIPIGNVGNPDRIVWPWSANGEYSVKSGYHRIHALRFDLSGVSAHSSHIINPVVWKELWSLVSQPKIKLFLWRLLSRSLATCLNLFRRKIRESPLCPICEELEESEEHLFFLCPWVRTVWFGSELNYRINPQSFRTFDQWFLNLTQMEFSSKVDKNWCLTYISFILWAIWKSRCHFIFEGVKLEPIEVLRSASSSTREFMEVQNSAAQASFVSRSVDNLSVHWSPPRRGWFKVNSDAAWRKDTNRAGLGVMIRDSEGLLCGGSAEGIICPSVLLAEAKAALGGLKLALDSNYRKVNMETDSLVLKAGVDRKYGNRAWEILPIILEIRRMEALFDAVEWSWIPRKKNRAAHAAASFGTRAVHRVTWLDQPPPSLMGVLTSDGLPCPPVI